MLVYRITKKQFASDLSGEGARLYGGRWNFAGTSMVYTSEFASLAILELLVHLSIENARMIFVISTIDIGDSIQSVKLEDLPKDWQTVDSNLYLIELAERWIEEQKSVALKVPSVVLPLENNLLLNPLHPSFKNVKVVSQQEYSFDKRLFF